MTKHTKVVAERRAQIFNLLRSESDEDAETSGTPEPRYLDDATAAQLIRRAVTSFEAPPVVVPANSASQPRLRVGHRNRLGAVASPSV